MSKATLRKIYLQNFCNHQVYLGLFPLSSTTESIGEG